MEGRGPDEGEDGGAGEDGCEGVGYAGSPSVGGPLEGSPPLGCPPDDGLSTLGRVAGLLVPGPTVGRGLLGLPPGPGPFGPDDGVGDGPGLLLLGRSFPLGRFGGVPVGETTKTGRGVGNVGTLTELGV